MSATNGDSIGGDNNPSDAAELKAAIETLLQVDASTLQRHWRALIGGAFPPGLGRQLVLRILAYKLQARRLGDLDKASQRALSAALKGEKRQADPAIGAPPTENAFDPNESSENQRALIRPAFKLLARPGTMLMREHAGVLHRVMVLDHCVTWNGRTYDSLSQVAFAITGTRWNGPRFFGLRDKPTKADVDERSHPPRTAATPSVLGKRRLPSIAQVNRQRATP